MKNFAEPVKLTITGAQLLELDIPNYKPNIEAPGTYAFAVAATEPGTEKFVSNIATVSFNIE